MDLKFKGRALVGSIYHKFEAMCLEVDDFVNQDTVKYVENQVQTVGESMKRFCSDVVQELLPPLVDPVKHETQAVTPKQDDAIGNYIRSMIGIEEDHVIDIKKSYFEPDPVDPSKQVLPLPSADTIREADSDFSLGQEDETLIDRHLYMGVEENVAKGELSLSDDLDFISPENKDLSEPSLFSESVEEKYINGFLLEVSPQNTVHGEVLISDKKEGTVHNSFSDELEVVSDVSSTPPSSGLPIAVVSGENKIEETGLISSSSSLSKESYSLSEFSHANFPQTGENNPVVSIECVSDLSNDHSPFESFPIVSYDNKVEDMGFAFSSSFLSLEPNDANTSRTDEVVSLVGSSGNRSEHECAQLEAFMSSFHIGCHGNAQGEADDFRVDIADPSMETIELSDKVKLDESCVIVDDKLLFEVSSRANKSRSYKKMIQDAFTSKKRLRKEYEQLPIWYGDVDIDFSQHSGQNVLPSIASMSLNSKKSPTHDLCDSEWEIL
ncbi:uncharacterized protein LOC132308603 isoform X2 [Cornus florida]|uniref:uncharacterized protein LOC132308603 isoform X2 n=1 Tax=Cornus florida TaxID=4283 RepID=UPI00289E8053|nr:uncharacterized protein LOC132308603 isoform X2 [Cornus florida]